MAIQESLYLTTLFVASITAILGLILVNHLIKTKKYFDNRLVFIFSFLTFGYVCFALAELAWYLLFKVFNQAPTVSMPDFYWVMGSLSLLLGFSTFSFHTHREHGDIRTTMLLLVFGTVVLGAVLYYVLGSNIGSTEGSVFLSYYYPIMSSLILIASLSVYLFQEKIALFHANLLLLFIANIAFLLGDLFVIDNSAVSGFGLTGILPESMYILAYILCAYSFLSMLLKTRTQ